MDLLLKASNNDEDVHPVTGVFVRNGLNALDGVNISLDYREPRKYDETGGGLLSEAAAVIQGTWVIQEREIPRVRFVMNGTFVGCPSDTIFVLTKTVYDTIVLVALKKKVFPTHHALAKGMMEDTGGNTVPCMTLEGKSSSSEELARIVLANSLANQLGLDRNDRNVFELDIRALGCLGLVGIEEENEQQQQQQAGVEEEVVVEGVVVEGVVEEGVVVEGVVVEGVVEEGVVEEVVVEGVVEEVVVEGVVEEVVLHMVEGGEEEDAVDDTPSVQQQQHHQAVVVEGVEEEEEEVVVVEEKEPEHQQQHHQAVVGAGGEEIVVMENEHEDLAKSYTASNILSFDEAKEQVLQLASDTTSKIINPDTSVKPLLIPKSPLPVTVMFMDTIQSGISGSMSLEKKEESGGYVLKLHLKRIILQPEDFVFVAKSSTIPDHWTLVVVGPECSTWATFHDLSLSKVHFHNNILMMKNAEIQLDPADLYIIGMMKEEEELHVSKHIHGDDTQQHQAVVGAGGEEIVVEEKEPEDFKLIKSVVSGWLKGTSTLKQLPMHYEPWNTHYKLRNLPKPTISDDISKDVHFELPSTSMVFVDKEGLTTMDPIQFVLKKQTDETVFKFSLPDDSRFLGKSLLWAKLVKEKERSTSTSILFAIDENLIETLASNMKLFFQHYLLATRVHYSIVDEERLLFLVPLVPQLGYTVRYDAVGPDYLIHYAKPALPTPHKKEEEKKKRKRTTM